MRKADTGYSILDVPAGAGYWICKVIKLNNKQTERTKNKSNNMKFIVSLILMALLSFATCLYLPWWSIAIVCFLIAALIPQRPATAFICGFISLFILWAGLSFWISMNNEHILAHKMSVIILKKDNPVMLILVTGLIGAVVAGFASLTGSIVRLKTK